MLISMAKVASLAWHLLVPPFLFVLCLTLILASFGKSLGIRKLYVKTLIRIFEMARTLSIEAKKESERQRRRHELGDDDEVSMRSVEDASRLTGVSGDDLTTAPSSVTLNTSNASSSNTSLATSEADVTAMRQRMRQLGKGESRHNVISRKDNLMLTPDRASTIYDDLKKKLNRCDSGLKSRVLANVEESPTKAEHEFELDDVLVYVKTGIASIIEDEVTQRFVAEELKSWNLLTRTSQTFEFVNMKLTAVWVIGFLFRYCVLLPGRFCILVVGLLWLAICMTFIGNFRNGPMKKKLYFYAYTSCFQVLGGALSAVIKYHGKENRPKNGICVANHTSPIDVLILAGDNAYDLIGQRYTSGLLRYFQKVLSKCSDHIWFERSESKDRMVVQKRLKEHVDDPEKLPILIFPEGTCINNTSVMQFKKGSFEVGGIIYPVAIKYDPLFGDAFWNSSQNGMMSYIYLMMTSWAIVCDVWYLPPMKKGEDEDAITFANRVKAVIARQGGLVDLVWDGNLKRGPIKTDWKANQQLAFSRRLKAE